MRRLVLDQNYFRDVDLQTRLDNAAEDDEFVITDYAFIEMFKTQQWELTTRKSLAAVSEHPELIVVSRAPSDLMNAELLYRQPTTERDDFLDMDLTYRTREYLRELSRYGQSGARHAYVSSMINKAQNALDVQQQNHSVNLQNLKNAVQGCEHSLCSQFLSDLRAGRISDERRAFLAIEIAKDAIHPLLLENGASKQQADQFLKGDSFLLRSQVSFTLLALNWCELGGVQNLPNQATNELMDIDYALFGSYCDGVLTKEETVTRHHQLITIAIPMIQCEAGEASDASSEYN